MSAGTSFAGLQEEYCQYSKHSCSRSRFQTYKYCALHILEDEGSPYTSCEYISRSSKRKCPNPALRQKKSSSTPTFCDDHMRNLIARGKLQKQRKKLKKKKRAQKHLDVNPIEKQRHKWIDQIMKYRSDYVEGQGSQQYVSSDSEPEEIHRPITDDWLLENSEDTKNDADWDDFDPVNNEVFEPLRYAEVLTPEEVVATTQSKLIRLQSLYIEQFKRLFYLLKESRREYLQERKKEDKDLRSGKISPSSIYTSELTDEEIRALANHRKRSGIEVLLRKRQKRRRMEAGGETSLLQSEAAPPRCSHIQQQSRCQKQCLPYTKYCSEHILNDPHQVMYKKCHVETCQTPVCPLLNLPHKIMENEGEEEPKEKELFYCTLHAPLPDLTFNFDLLKKTDDDVEEDASKSYSHTEKESQTSQKDEEMEDEDVVVVDDIPSNKLVKTGSDLTNLEMSQQASTSSISIIESSEIIPENIAEITLAEPQNSSFVCKETGNSAEDNETEKINVVTSEDKQELFADDIQVSSSKSEPSAMEPNTKEPSPPTHTAHPHTTTAIPIFEKEPQNMDVTITSVNQTPLDPSTSKVTVGPEGETCTQPIPAFVKSNSPAPIGAHSPLHAPTEPSDLLIPEPTSLPLQSNAPSLNSNAIDDPEKIEDEFLEMRTCDGQKPGTSSTTPQEQEKGPPPVAPLAPPVASSVLEPPTKPEPKFTVETERIAGIGITVNDKIKTPNTGDLYPSQGEHDEMQPSVSLTQLLMPEPELKAKEVKEELGVTSEESCKKNQDEIPFHRNNETHDQTVTAIETALNVDKLTEKTESCKTYLPETSITMEPRIVESKPLDVGRHRLLTQEKSPLSFAPESTRAVLFEGNPAFRDCGERKPSSADEEMAIVSLLSLRTGHPSDDNTHSSSAEMD